MTFRLSLALSFVFVGLTACTAASEETSEDVAPAAATTNDELRLDADSARRCLAAGIAPARCRALLSDERTERERAERPTTIAGRCRAAGYTPQQCRRLVAETPERDDGPLRGDFDGNGRVDQADVRILESQWGPVRGANRADLNVDGVVDGADLGLLLGLFSGR
jgi:hypothetical protein